MWPAVVRLQVDGFPYVVNKLFGLRRCEFHLRSELPPIITVAESAGSYSPLAGYECSCPSISEVSSNA